MRFFVYSNHDEVSLSLKSYITEQLIEENNFILDENNPELVISIGGDGRFLKSIRKYIDKLKNVHFVGLSSGKLGFLCDYRADEVNELISDIINNIPQYDNYHILEVFNGKDYQYYVNEFRIETIFNTLNLDIDINGKFFEHFRGNGINVSTPIGSTAYNRSLGGPIINPHLGVMVLGEIASLNHNLHRNLNSFLVLSSGDELKITGKINDGVLGGDVIFDQVKDSEITFKIKLSETKVSFARYRSNEYYQRVKNSFID